MAHGVFIHRPDSIYDDVPSERYQFPPQYLKRAQTFVGDWIVYYEPRKVAATRGYFAVAKVQDIIPDPTIPKMFLAIIEPGSYLDFGSPVPLRGPDGVRERGILTSDGRMSGRAQAAVRPLSGDDFDRILALGLLTEDPTFPRTEVPKLAPGFEEPQAPLQLSDERRRAEYLGSRLVRDRNFRGIVLKAYGKRCAVTGLRLINGSGRAEVEAAHIQPVEAKGPDLLANGMALSGTAHWMFDRGLISVADDLKILVSRQVNDPDAVHSMMNDSGYIIAPQRPTDHPHPRFLRWHRENCFKC